MTSRRDSIELEELGACPIAVIAQIIKKSHLCYKENQAKGSKGARGNFVLNVIIRGKKGGDSDLG